MFMEIVICVILFFVGIGVLVIIHICIVGRAFRGGFGNGNVVQRGSTGGTSMSHDDLKKLPCFEYKAGERGTSPVDCVVCLENFKMGDKCRLLPICKHSFHTRCIDSWLLMTPICPICRTCTNSSKIDAFSGEPSSNSSVIGAELT